MKLKVCMAVFILSVLSIVTIYGQTDRLTIIHVNDSHSHLLPWGPKNASDVGTIGGMARVASIVGNLKATSPNPIFLHGGDVFGGDLMFNRFFGVPEFQILAALGCDAMAIGNHEFQYYPPTLIASLQNAGFPGLFPLLCANLDMSGYPDLDPYVQDYVIKEYGSTRVGIFGLVTETTNTIANPDPVIVTDPAPAAAAMVAALASESCDLIILLSHLGLMTDQMLAAGVPGIDIIVGAHSHTLLSEAVPVKNATTGDTTFIVQADWAYSHVGKLTVDVTGTDFNIIEYDVIPVDDSVPEEPGTAATIEGLKTTIEADFRYGAYYTDLIAEAATTHSSGLGAGEYKDSKMGDLIVDALREAAGTDMAFAANGFIRQSIYQGKLTAMDIFQVLPEGLSIITGYGSALSKFEIDAASLIAGMEFSVSLIEYDDTFFLNPSGLTFDFDITRPVGSRVDIASIRINGQPIELTRRYTAAVNADLVPMLALAGVDTVYNVQEVSNSEYMVVRDYIVANSPIDHTGENRVRDISFTAIDDGFEHVEMAESYHLGQNYPNPFNPQTTISYHVPKADHVRVSVFNTLGQEIRVLVDNAHQSGVYTVIWDGADSSGDLVSSGLYFSRLKAGDVHMARPMVLMK